MPARRPSPHLTAISPATTAAAAPPPPSSSATQDTGIARNQLRDQYYTRDDIASDCIRTLIESNTIPPNATWVEPAAGTGAFLRALAHHLPQCTAIALDLHPKAPQIRQLDFLAWQPLPNRPTHPIIVFGNPPFGRKSAAANAFIRHATRFATVVAFILPRSFMKPSMHHVFPPNYHLQLSKPLPPNAFVVNDQPHDVPCVFQIWTRQSTPRPITAITSPNYFEYTRNPHRDPAAPYDLALRRVGATAGIAYLPSLAFHNPNTHYFIRFRFPYPHNTEGNHDLISRFLHDHINQHQHLFQRENTTGPRSISQAEFTSVINPFLATILSQTSPWG